LHVISERKDLEAFFLDSLDYVRNELKKERERKKKDIQFEYRKHANVS
jgi:hypothetical protein